MRQTIYHGTDAILLETERASATFLPSRGCKLASVRYDGFEYLVQPEEAVLSQVFYDDSYAPGGLFGMDDMFPTINSSFYPCSPWRGTPLPDHGECWTQPFQVQTHEETLSAQMTGVRLPYILKKEITFTGTNRLHIRYEIQNISIYPFHFIWAAHPLCIVFDDSLVYLPEEIDSVINTLHIHNHLGKNGAIHTWPLTTDQYGDTLDLRALGPTDGTGEKFFSNSPFSSGTITLEHPSAKQKLSLHFPAKEVPYAGIWMNRGGYLGLHHVGLEPATGSLDDLYLAYHWEKCAVIPPNDVYSFYLDLEMGGYASCDD